eukprot:1153343-Pelagomonas_calceolata.AAC.8
MHNQHTRTQTFAYTYSALFSSLSRSAPTKRSAHQTCMQPHPPAYCRPRCCRPGYYHPPRCTASCGCCCRPASPLHPPHPRFHSTTHPWASHTAQRPHHPHQPRAAAAAMTPRSGLCCWLPHLARLPRPQSHSPAWAGLEAYPVLQHRCLHW